MADTCGFVDACGFPDQKNSPPIQETGKCLEQFALPFAREERISLVKMLFATRQNLQTNSKDALELILKPEFALSNTEKIDHFTNSRTDSDTSVD